MIKIRYQNSIIEFANLREAKELFGEQLLAFILHQAISQPLASLEIKDEPFHLGKDTRLNNIIGTLSDLAAESKKKNKPNDK